MSQSAVLAELVDVELEVHRPVYTRILHPLTLRVGRSTSLAVVGPSGAGKTTLAAILGALQPPSGGTYHFAGANIADLSRKESARFRNLNIGFVFQNANLIDERSAWRNVAIALTDPTLERRVVEQRCREALADVGLQAIADREAALLSGGERQRVAIARAMVKNPLMVIADEPTGALDQTTGRDVLALLYGVTARGATLVIVSHDPYAASLAASSVSLVDGRIAE